MGSVHGSSLVSARPIVQTRGLGLEGSTALATLELAKVKGYVSHATRMHFWAQRIFTAPLPEALAAHV